MDIIGPYDLENNSKTYLLHIIDQSTRLSEIKVMKTISTNEVIKSLKENWLLKHPLPKVLVLDNCRQFISKNFEGFLAQFDIVHRKTLSYNTRRNSIIERSYQEIINGLKYTDTRNLESAIQHLNDAHNSMYHMVLKCSPMQLAFGRRKYYLKGIENISELLIVTSLQTNDISEI